MASWDWSTMRVAGERSRLDLFWIFSGKMMFLMFFPTLVVVVGDDGLVRLILESQSPRTVHTQYANQYIIVGRSKEASKQPTVEIARSFVHTATKQLSARCNNHQELTLSLLSLDDLLLLWGTYITIVCLVCGSNSSSGVTHLPGRAAGASRDTVSSD